MQQQREHVILLLTDGVRLYTREDRPVVHWKLSKISSESKRGTKNFRKKNNISRGTDVPNFKSSGDSEKETKTTCCPAQGRLLALEGLTGLREMRPGQREGHERAEPRGPPARARS